LIKWFTRFVVYYVKSTFFAEPLLVSFSGEAVTGVLVKEERGSTKLSTFNLFGSKY
jgi:hypothetical protein